ncbi:phage tail protein [Nitratireductor kimnyeongensis]|uniref:Phage tail protein n=1 Tax=Nitratireductor kimnyeongensis TaxID=430679 RepID=A0ABW0T758_9HYPH|nr:phage tail protein [Nitratireductor kimnyeongensis]QZZ34588.1 phage tail protein [Nitratireductor kimnyeongensis]
MPFIGAAIGAVVSAVGAVASFIGGLGFLGKLVIGIGLNLAASALLKQKQKAPEPTGVKIHTEYGADVPRQVACGLVGIAGHEIHVNTFGNDNGWLQDVYQLSDYPCTSLERVAINGEWVTLDAPQANGYRKVTSGEYANLAWIKFHDGTQVTADPDLVDNANPIDRWGESCVGVGCSYVIVKAKYDREKTVGMPDVFFEFKGAKLYDWRKDSTVGGTGPHRWNDPSTHEWTDNPIVIDYNYRRGLSVNGDLFCGMEMPASDLPLDKFTAAANVCDEIVEGEKRYRCSILLDCTATHGNNIESIMKACGGVVIDAPDGSWPMIGAAQPVVATITDVDLVVGEPVRWQAKRSMAELVNSISGTHPDPSQLWSMVGYDPVVLDSAIVVDRRTRDLVMDFPTVTSARQAKQLASIYAAENRLEATAEITLRPRWRGLKAGDWITWQSDRYGTLTYLVTESTLYSLDSQGPRNVRIALQQRDASIYDAVTVPVPVVPYPPGKPVYLQEVQNLQLAGVTAGSGTKLMPAIQTSWDAIEDVTVVGVELEWWPTDDPVSRVSMTVADDQTIAVLTEAVVSDTEYQVRTRLLTSPQRPIAWSAPMAVTTPDQPFTDVSVDYEAIGEFVNEATDWIGWNTREEIERARQNIILDIEQDAANYLDKQQLRRELASTTGDMNARWGEDITLITGEQFALSQRLEEFQAETEDDFTNITNLFSAEISRVDGDVTANSNALTALTAQVDDVSAEANFRMEVTAGASGYASRIGAQARVGGTGNWRSAAWFLDVPSDDQEPTRFAAIADQFVFSDGTDVFRPVVIENGALYADQLFVDWAKIRNVSIGTAQIANGAITDAKIANAAITSAKIADLSVDTLKLAGDAINVTNSAYTAGAIWVSFSQTDVQSVTLNVPADALFVRCIFTAQTSNVNYTPVFNFYVDGNFLLTDTVSRSPFQVEFVWMTPTPGNHTFLVKMFANGAGPGTGWDVSHRRLHAAAQRR